VNVRFGLAGAGLLAVALSGCARRGPRVSPAATELDRPTESPREALTPVAQTGGAKVAPLDIKLPTFREKGTPPNTTLGRRIEKFSDKPRDPFVAPVGTRNVAFRKPVSGSEEDPIIGELELVTNGEKEAEDGSHVELGPGVQYVQVDLEAECRISAVLFWLCHGDWRVCHDVVLRVADDPDFITGVKTLFNNDHDNSAGLGIGKDLEFWESYKGKLVDAKGVEARYVRLYTNGSTVDELNRHTELEVYGLPAGDGG
jgi:hypothetical protein